MYDKNKIISSLAAISHPEQDTDIVSSGIVKSVETGEDIIIALAFARGSRDPFSKTIKRQVENVIGELYPEAVGRIHIEITEPAPKVNTVPEGADGGTSMIRHIVAVASGKGGVGKSTVTANLAVTLRNMGYRVGILDADIYGPSQPKMFGLEGFIPTGEEIDGRMLIIPAESMGIKLASIGFFISADDALAWRGPMATSALKQLIHQTNWGELDFLLIDMPPGTGDVHLSVATELKIDGAVIVSTPQQVAVADVIRGVSFFNADGINTPVLGIIENMAWFTPTELPDNRYYIFGRGGAKELADSMGIEFLGDIPIVQSVMEGGESGRPGVTTNSEVEKYFREIAIKIVDKLRK